MIKLSLLFVVIMLVLYSCTSLGSMHPQIDEGGSFLSEHTESSRKHADVITDEQSIGSEQLLSYIDVIEKTESETLKDIDDHATESSKLSPVEKIRNSNLASLQEPSNHSIRNSVIVYNYWDKFTYKVYTSPQRVTMIRLGADEKIIGNLAAGDTANWLITTAEDKDRNIVYIKPVRTRIDTNLIINTSKRNYYLSLVSLDRTYMVSVEWVYPGDVIQNTSNKKTILDVPISLDTLYFGYQLLPLRKAPSWMPNKIFDDGVRTYIHFSNKRAISEAPVLYATEENGELQLINYRIIGNYYVLDKILHHGELRLGEKKKNIVKVVRLSR